MNQQVDNALGGYDESLASVGGGSNSQDADVGDLAKPAPVCTQEEADMQAVERGLMGFLFETCQPNEGDVFSFIDDVKAELVRYMLSKSPVHAELARVKAENDRLANALKVAVEALQFYSADFALRKIEQIAKGEII